MQQHIKVLYSILLYVFTYSLNIIIVKNYLYFITYFVKPCLYINIIITFVLVYKLKK